MRGGYNNQFVPNPYMNPPVMFVNTRMTSQFGNHPMPPSMQQQQAPIDFVDGILIQQQYEPEKGDPVVIEQAVFKGKVVKVGDKNKQVVQDKQSILISQGYASEDKKHWKFVAKISMNVFRLGQLNIKDITKIKARYEQKLPGHKVLKLSCKQKEYYLAFKEQIFNQWFLRVVWAKLILSKTQSSDFGNWDADVAGKLYKKSFVMGDWQPRVVKVDSRGLRASKDNKSAVNLQILSTKEIWTRFEQIHGGYSLVVKLWNGILKQQFAVPTSFCLKWLYHILKLLSVK